MDIYVTLIAGTDVDEVGLFKSLEEAKKAYHAYLFPAAIEEEIVFEVMIYEDILPIPRLIYVYVEDTYQGCIIKSNLETCAPA